MTRKLIIHRAKSLEELVRDRKGKLIAVIRVEADKTGVNVAVDKVQKRSKNRIDLVRIGKHPSGLNVWYYNDSPQYLWVSSGQNSPPNNLWKLDEITLPVLAKVCIRECRRRGLLLLNDSPRPTQK